MTMEKEKANTAKPIPIAKTTEIDREEWLKVRRNGIGGSDAATVVGLNPYKSAIELWADKTGRLEEKPDTEAMRIGRDLEQYVAERFCEATGKRVRRRNAVFSHGKYPYIIADIDREVIGENAGLECKTTSLFAKSDFENGEIPLYYMVQCRHYMNVMGYDKMYLAVLVLGRAFYWYEIPYDESENEALLNAELTFWNTYIKPDTRPNPDGSESSQRTIEKLYGDDFRDNTIAMFEQDTTAAELAKIKSKIKELQATESQLKQELILALDGNTEGLTEHFAIQYKTTTRKLFDTKRFSKEHGDIYNEYCKTTETKTLTCKERKEE